MVAGGSPSNSLSYVKGNAVATKIVGDQEPPMGSEEPFVVTSDDLNCINLSEAKFNELVNDPRPSMNY